MGPQQNLQTFLLSGQPDGRPDRVKGERHPQRSRLGTPVRGGDTKKKGRGGKGTWMGDGSLEPMKNGALDRNDPNYSSSGSSSDDEDAYAHRASISYPQQQPQQVRQFKRIGLDQLFEGAAKSG